MLLTITLLYTGCAKQSPVEVKEFDFNNIEQSFIDEAGKAQYDSKSASIFYKTLKRVSSDINFKKIDVKKDVEDNGFFHIDGDDMYYATHREKKDISYYNICKYNKKSKEVTTLLTGRNYASQIKQQPFSLDFLKDDGGDILIDVKTVYQNHILFYATVYDVALDDEDYDEDEAYHSWDTQKDDDEDETDKNEQQEFDEKDFLFIYNIETKELNLISSYCQNAASVIEYSGALYNGEFYFNGPYKQNKENGNWEPTSIYKYNFQTKKDTLYKKNVCDPFIYEKQLGYAKTSNRKTVATENGEYVFHKINEGEKEEGKEVWEFPDGNLFNKMAADQIFDKKSIQKVKQKHSGISKFEVPSQPPYSESRGIGIYHQGKFQPLIITQRFIFLGHDNEDLIFITNENDYTIQLLLYDLKDPENIYEIYFDKQQKNTRYSFQFLKQGEDLTIIKTKFVGSNPEDDMHYNTSYIATIKLNAVK